jgi:hypothetical protein
VVLLDQLTRTQQFRSGVDSVLTGIIGEGERLAGSAV